MKCRFCVEAGEKCEDPAGTDQRNPLHLSALGLTDDDIQAWDAPVNLDVVARTSQYFRSLSEDLTRVWNMITNWIRHSSHPGPAVIFVQAVNASPQTLQTYETLLRGPLLPGIPEGTMPGGTAAQLSTQLVQVARQGTIPIATQTPTNAAAMPVSLHNFVATLPHLTNNHPNPPREWHQLTQGLAGACAGIQGWGDDHHGFFQFVWQRDLAHGTDIAQRIYIVSIVNRDIVDGTQPHSLPAHRLQHWHLHRNKYIRKEKLADLIQRNTVCLNQALQNHQNNTPNQAPPMTFDAARDAKLNDFLYAHHREWELRAQQLGPNTIPYSDTAVLTANIGRNDPCQRPQRLAMDDNGCFKNEGQRD